MHEHACSQDFLGLVYSYVIVYPRLLIMGRIIPGLLRYVCNNQSSADNKL